MLALFVFFARHRIQDAVVNLSAESHQEILFLVFLLFAFIITAVTFLRRYSLIPVLGVLFCLYLMIEIPARSWMVFFGWMAVGLAIYLLYGRRKSKLVNS